MKRRIVLPGPPAFGKATEAESIQQQFGIPDTSPGVILRAGAKHGAPLEAGKIISPGSLAPDEMVLHLVAAWLEVYWLASTPVVRGIGF